MAASPDSPMISWDSWGLIATGVVILVLWLAFRRIFREKPGDEPKPKP
jgi:hypothetical protein